MERTKLGLLKPRSGSLKSLDEALKAYGHFPNQHHLRKVRLKFDEWKAEKGDWKKSERKPQGRGHGPR